MSSKLKEATITIYGNAIAVSKNGIEPLDDTIATQVKGLLFYEQTIFQHGYRAKDEYGHRSPVRKVPKLLYTQDDAGHIITKAGFIDRLTRLFNAYSYTVNLNDITPTHDRPDRFYTDWDAIFREFELRPRQDELLAAIASNDRGVIESCTGSGKSHLFATIPVLYPKANIVIVCTRKDVVESIVRNVAKYVYTVGQIGGGRKDRSRVTVSTAQSLDYVDYDNTDIVLGDEGHELAAGVYAGKLGLFNWARMYMFSASPYGRKDGTNIRVEALFGQNIFTMSYQEGVKYGMVLPIRVEWLNVQLQDNPCAGMDNVRRKRFGLWCNVARNEIIANKAQTYGSDDQVLIMVTTLEHAVYLRQFLPEYTLCYGERSQDNKLLTKFKESGMLPADEPRMTAERRVKLREQFERGELKKVICTDVWSTGVNFAQLSVLIRADGRSSTIADTQLPGRVCRLHNASGKEIGVVVDCLDQFDRSYRSAARKRQHNYELKGWEQMLPAEELF